MGVGVEDERMALGNEGGLEFAESEAGEVGVWGHGLFEWKPFIGVGGEARMFGAEGGCNSAEESEEKESCEGEVKHSAQMRWSRGWASRESQLLNGGEAQPEELSSDQPP
jgi:hypothetical protein